MKAEDIVRQRARQALAEAAGNANEARRLMALWAAADDKLLRALAGPYLPGLIAKAVAASAAPAAEPARRQLTGTALDGVVGTLARSIGASRDPVGMSALLDQPSPASAGDGHEAALRRLAASYRKPARRT